MGIRYNGLTLLRYFRQCPGQLLAEATAWLMAAYVTATMDILPTKNEQGEDIIPPEAWHPGFVV